MAVASLPLAGLFPAPVTESPGQNASSNITPLNPNDAQGAAVPQDTVTLTGQAAQGQQTAQNQQEPLFQETVIAVTETQVFATQNAGSAGAAQQTAQQPATSTPTQTAASATTSSPNSNQPNVAASAAATQGASNSTAAPTAASTSSAQQSQQQELQQLDQTLQQLGIDPQSIGLFNQLALLVYANDPSALQAFIQQLQQSSQQIIQQGLNTTAAQGATQAGQQSQSSNASSNGAAQGNTQGASLTELSASDIQATTSQNSSNNQSSSTPQPANPAAQNNTISLQYQKLQLTVAAVSGQTQSPSFGGTATAVNGQTLNVTY